MSKDHAPRPEYIPRHLLNAIKCSQHLLDTFQGRLDEDGMIDGESRTPPHARHARPTTYPTNPELLLEIINTFEHEVAIFRIAYRKIAKKH